ncbi:MAG: hypothetical protein ABI147_02115 [Acidobacteriaceae bacterium]
MSSAIKPQAPRPRSSKAFRWFAWITLLLASAQFVRCYMIVTFLIYTKPFFDLRQYAAGVERMPFQGRMLMMFPLRWAERSPLLARMTAGKMPPFNSPEELVITLVGLASVVLTGVLVTWLYRRLSPTTPFIYLPFALTLVFLVSNYLLHMPFMIMYPYDLLGVLFFTAGVTLIYTRRFWLLLPVFIAGCFNRETMLFLVPLFLVDGLAAENNFDWKRLKKLSLPAQTLALCAIWLAIHVYILHRFRANHGEFYPQNLDPGATHRHLNFMYLLQLKFWPQLDNACAYMLPFLILLRRYIFPFRLRAYILVLPLWVLTMVVFGLLPETRIYGELSGLVAVLATMLLEGYVKARAQRGEFQKESQRASIA